MERGDRKTIWCHIGDQFSRGRSWDKERVGPMYFMFTIHTYNTDRILRDMRSF